MIKLAVIFYYMYMLLAKSEALPIMVYTHLFYT